MSQCISWPSAFGVWSNSTVEKCQTCSRELPLGEVYLHCAACTTAVCEGCVNRSELAGLELCMACASKFAEGICPNCKHPLANHFKGRKVVMSDAISCTHQFMLFTSTEDCKCLLAVDLAKRLNAVLP